jgi:hypothetical protein
MSAASLYSPAEAATKLGVTDRMLARMRSNGNGPEFVRVGYRTVRYASEALEAFIAANSRKSTSEVSE